MRHQTRKTIFKIVRNLVVFLLILAPLLLGMAWLGGSGPISLFSLGWEDKAEFVCSIVICLWDAWWTGFCLTWLRAQKIGWISGWKLQKVVVGSVACKNCKKTIHSRLLLEENKIEHPRPQKEAGVRLLGNLKVHVHMGKLVIKKSRQTASGKMHPQKSPKKTLSLHVSKYWEKYCFSNAQFSQSQGIQRNRATWAIQKSKTNLQKQNIWNTSFGL